MQLKEQTRLRNYLLVFAALVSILAIFIYISYRTKKKANVLIAKERARSEDLLHNILPVSIAERLKQGEMIADYIEEASIIFIDIKDFTQLSADAKPERIVEVLNSIFTTFDKIAKKYNIEKIKTIGDCYMAAAGIPEKLENHVEAITEMAVEAMEMMRNYSTEDGTEIRFRIGVDTGPIVAGVIGEQKFIYDLWGDPVNCASRMEEYGIPDHIQCTERFKEKLIENVNNKNGSKYILKERGDVEIKISYVCYIILA